jgi:hypothetical protein
MTAVADVAPAVHHARTSAPAHEQRREGGQDRAFFHRIPQQASEALE